MVENMLLVGCGNRGCVEKHASATSIGALARNLNLGKNLTAEDVYDLAKKGDARAQAIWKTAGEHLGIALATLMSLFPFLIFITALTGFIFGTEELADQVARIVRSIRTLDLKKDPSVSETLDWARTLVVLGVESIDAEQARDTLHILLKYQSDIERASKELAGVESPD